MIFIWPFRTPQSFLIHRKRIDLLPRLFTHSPTNLIKGTQRYKLFSNKPHGAIDIEGILDPLMSSFNNSLNNVDSSSNDIKKLNTPLYQKQGVFAVNKPL